MGAAPFSWLPLHATASTANSDKLAIAGSVNVLVFTNDAQATVESGALINQDADWHDDATNPHPNQAAQQAAGRTVKVTLSDEPWDPSMISEEQPK